MDQVDEIPLRSLFSDVLVEAGIDHVFGMPGGCTPLGGALQKAHESNEPWVVEVIVVDVPHFRLMPQ